jgi:hypothetical protein
VKFTGVKLAGGVELAAPVEKAAASPVKKTAADPRALEDHGGQKAWWRGRKTGCRLRRVETLASKAEAQ